MSPAFLLALPLAAVPVIIHLFNRTRRDTVRWGAMRFLAPSSQARRKLMRLSQLLLMLLRAALLLLLVLAMAQPMISVTWLGSSVPRDLILVLDNSMSTGQKVGNNIVFDLELERVTEIVEQLTAADRLRILLTSPSPEWLTETSISVDANNRTALLTQVARLKPSDGTADLLNCLQESINARPAGREMMRSIIVITDGQSYSWRTNATHGWESFNNLARNASPPVMLQSVTPTDDIMDSEINLAVDRLSASRGVVGAGQSVTLTASVKNYGTAVSQPSLMLWSRNSESIGVSTVPALAPGAGADVTISDIVSGEGVVDYSVRLQANDSLPADNTARYLLEVAPSIPILLVHGDEGAGPRESDVDHFLAAVGIQSSVSEGDSPAVFRPKSVHHTALAGEDLKSFACVVLANAPRLPTNVIRALEQYVHSGGGLWIALGDQSEIEFYNDSLFAQGRGIAPVGIESAVGNATDRNKFTLVIPPSSTHPATLLLSDTRRLDLDRLQIYRHFRLGHDANTAASILLKTESGDAIVVEKNHGRGRVIVQALPLGLAWSNFPLCQAYVVMVHEWLWYLIEPTLITRNLRPGEVLEADKPLDPSGTDSSAIELPSGRNVPVVGGAENDRLVFRYHQTAAPGEYILKLGGSARWEHERFFVQRDPEESNLAPLSAQERATFSSVSGILFNSAAVVEAPSDTSVVHPKPIAQRLLVVLIALMVLEMTSVFLLNRYRRPYQGRALETVRLNYQGANEPG